MMKPIKRIHHISATVGDPNETLYFYRYILGLRLVKQTVNFEDDGTYHLYFANQQANDGTIITFFPRMDDLTGRIGAGQVRRIAFSIPKNTLSDWEQQLSIHNVIFTDGNLFGERSLHIKDKHGLYLALVESDISAETKDILGFYGVELLSEKPDATFQLLVNKMGFLLTRVTDEYYKLQMVGQEEHKVFIYRNSIKRGRLGIGTVHHIAWSMNDELELSEWKTYLEKTYHVTSIKNRKYFKSAYFRDPGHIIFELATDKPGFTVDESYESLGQKLMLPKKYEHKRSEIEAALPKLNV